MFNGFGLKLFLENYAHWIFSKFFIRRDNHHPIIYGLRDNDAVEGVGVDFGQ
jgi:hypothetical protein